MKIIIAAIHEKSKQLLGCNWKEYQNNQLNDTQLKQAKAVLCNHLVKILLSLRSVS
jgi:hypothetical protein